MEPPRKQRQANWDRINMITGHRKIRRNAIHWPEMIDGDVIGVQQSNSSAPVRRASLKNRQAWIAKKT